MNLQYCDQVYIPTRWIRCAVELVCVRPKFVAPTEPSIRLFVLRANESKDVVTKPRSSSRKARQLVSGDVNTYNAKRIALHTTLPRTVFPYLVNYEHIEKQSCFDQ